MVYTIFQHAVYSKSRTGDHCLFADLLNASSSIWQPSKVRPSGDFFYSYVSEFVNSDTSSDSFDGSLSYSHKIQVFELKDSFTNTRCLSPFQKLLNVNLSLSTPNGIIQCKFADGAKKTTKSPKLFLLPDSHAAILTFTFELSSPFAEESQVEGWELGSYLKNLRRSKNNRPYFTLNTSDLHPASIDQLANITSDITLKPTTDNNLRFSIDDLLHFFLRDIDEMNLIPLSPRTLNGFSFIKKETALPENERDILLFRAARLYSNKYYPYDSHHTLKKEAFHMFQGISAMTFREGCCILVTKSQISNQIFAETYGSEVARDRYYWIYLLTFVQKVTLILTKHRLAELMQTGISSESIESEIELLTGLQIRTLFEEISPRTQHNDFYHHCKANLNIDRLHAELEQELHSLNQLSISKFQKQATEETERRKQFQSRFETRVNYILYAFTLLTILSTWKDASDVFVDGVSRFEIYTILGLLFSTIFIVYLAFKIKAILLKNNTE